MALGSAACGGTPSVGPADAAAGLPDAALITPDAADLAPDAAAAPSADAGPPGSADAGPLVEVPLTVRYATLQAVGQKFDALVAQGLAPVDVVTGTAAFAMTQPGVEAAGVDAASTTAWGRFTDGRLFLLPDNRTLVLDTTRPALVPFAATVLPVPAQSRIFNMLGIFELGGETADKLSGWLSDSGYPDVGTVSGGRVEELRTVSGDGVFYFNSHGGAGLARGFTGSFPSIFTSTDVLDGAGHTIDGPWTTFDDSYHATDLDAAIHADLDAVPPRLVYMRADTYEAPKPNLHWRYAFTGAFVDNYMSFGPNAVVIMDACFSGDYPSWPSSFQKKGAAAYVGWHGELRAPAGYGVSKTVVDRMLGGNQYDADTPPARPWDIASVFDLINKEKIGTTTVGSPLLFTAGGPAILVPAIKQLTTDADKRIVALDGAFGDVPGKVTLDGAELPLAGSWSPTHLEAKVADGAHGSVQVAVGARKGNGRALTHWDGTLTYTETRLGSQQVQIKVSVSLAADVADLRDTIDQDPYKMVLLDVRANQASTASFTAGGSYSVCSLSGGANLPWKADPLGTWFRVLANIDTIGKVMHLEILVNDLLAVTTKCNAAMTIEPLRFMTDVFDGSSADGDTVYLDLPMDDSWSIAPDSRTKTSPLFGYTEKIEWQGFTAQSVPDSKQPI
jgi:hypothetical protein